MVLTTDPSSLRNQNSHSKTPPPEFYDQVFVTQKDPTSQWGALAETYLASCQKVHSLRSPECHHAYCKLAIAIFRDHINTVSDLPISNRVESRHLFGRKCEICLGKDCMGNNSAAAVYRIPLFCKDFPSIAVIYLHAAPLLEF